MPSSRSRWIACRAEGPRWQKGQAEGRPTQIDARKWRTQFVNVVTELIQRLIVMKLLRILQRCGTLEEPYRVTMVVRDLGWADSDL